MRLVLDVDGEEHEVYLTREGDTVHVQIGDDKFEAKLGEAGTVTIGGKAHRVVVGDGSFQIDGQEASFRIADFQSGAKAGEKGAARAARIKPPMPGKIVSLHVQEGDEVAPGQVLVILEAMKMQNEITAPHGGKVKKVHVQPGQNVEGKDTLVELE